MEVVWITSPSSLFGFKFSKKFRNREGYTVDESEPRALYSRTRCDPHNTCKVYKNIERMDQEWTKLKSGFVKSRPCTC